MPPRLTINPDNDPELRALVQACLYEGLTTPAQLAACLRSRYAGVNVVAGVDDALQQHWYVYREGHWIHTR